MKKKTEKSQEISDKLIGEADKICACSAIVGDIITATNEAKKKKTPLKEILDSIKNKAQKRK